MRTFPAVLGLGLMLLLFAAVAVELSFGTWFDDGPLDRLGVPHDTATPVAAAALYDGGGAFVHQRDHWGLRGAGIDPSQVTVLTVGGDAVSQFNLPDESTWQAVMERDLRAAGRTVVVANAGVDGQGSAGHLRALREWFPQVPALKPHFVLFFLGQADADGAVDALPRAHRVKWLRQHSALWQVAARLFGIPAEARLRQDHQRVDLAAAQWTDAAGPSEGAPDLDAYKDRLRQLAQDSHAMGAVPVFVTQTRADFRLVDGKVQGMVEEDGVTGIDHYRRLAAVNRATREVCAEQGLLCLDLAREVTFEPGDFYDYLHNTPQGAARIGHWLAAKLAGLV